MLYIKFKNIASKASLLIILNYMAIKKEAAKNKEKKPRGFWSELLIIDKIKERRESGLSLSPHKVQAEDSSLYAAASSCFNSWGKAVEAAGYDYLGTSQNN
ncbi:MAG: hypothetical protein PHT62_05815 [Desulfotomaculaceae bacterium]|nr:hypothetical protein [Desulfotomaculaceae bacterium]